VHRFPIDVLKVDRAFVEAGTHDPAAQALLGGLVLFARSLDLTTVAEGVESAAQGDLVSTLGYEFAQGYHYDRPLTLGEIEARLCGAPLRGRAGADASQRS
jgi:EAL domain-containing protein (putative c-di-GMP-specific phosphodiesterase class I)